MCISSSSPCFADAVPAPVAECREEIRRLLWVPVSILEAPELHQRFGGLHSWGCMFAPFGTYPGQALRPRHQTLHQPDSTKCSLSCNGIPSCRSYQVRLAPASQQSTHGPAVLTCQPPTVFQGSRCRLRNIFSRLPVSLSFLYNTTNNPPRLVHTPYMMHQLLSLPIRVWVWVLTSLFSWARTPVSWSIRCPKITH